MIGNLFKPKQASVSKSEVKDPKIASLSTYDAIDQGAMSDIGLPIVYFDSNFLVNIKIQHSPTAQIATYAQQRGYRVHVLAPGVDPSFIPDWANCCNLNLLDFVEDSKDIHSANRLASSFLTKFRHEHTQRDLFLDPLEINLFTALILVAKSTDYPDLLTCLQLLAHPDLFGLLSAQTVSESAKAHLYNFGKDSKTFASVQATLWLLLHKVLTPKIAASICSRTTLPLDPDGKDFIILGVDRQNLEVAPLLASVLHMHVTRFLSLSKQKPYRLFVNESVPVHLPILEELIPAAESHHWEVDTLGLLNKMLTQAGWANRFSKDDFELRKASIEKAFSLILQCQKCINHVGETFEGHHLVCAIHPCGVDGACPDLQQTETDVVNDSQAIEAVGQSPDLDATEALMLATEVQNPNQEEIEAHLAKIFVGIKRWTVHGKTSGHLFIMAPGVPKLSAEIESQVLSRLRQRGYRVTRDAFSEIEISWDASTDCTDTENHPS